MSCQARRWWTYPRDSCYRWPPLRLGTDEFGNSTVMAIWPNGSALIVALTWPLRRELLPDQ